VQKTNPRKKIDVDAGAAFFSGEKYVIYMNDSLGNMLARAHASATYTKPKIKSKTQRNVIENTSSIIT